MSLFCCFFGHSMKTVLEFPTSFIVTKPSGTTTTIGIARIKKCSECGLEEGEVAVEIGTKSIDPALVRLRYKEVFKKEPP